MDLDNFEEFSGGLKSAMDETAKSRMKDMIDDFYGEAKDGDDAKDEKDAE